MRKPKKEIQLTSYDELLGINEAEQNTLNQIVEVPLKSNRGKYCPDCAGRMKKLKAAERKRKQRQRCHALEPFKTA